LGRPSPDRREFVRAGAHAQFLRRYAFLFAAGFGMLLFFSTLDTVLQTIVHDQMRQRVMGVWSVVFGAMIPLAP